MTFCYYSHELCLPGFGDFARSHAIGGRTCTNKFIVYLISIRLLGNVNMHAHMATAFTHIIATQGLTKKQVITTGSCSHYKPVIHTWSSTLKQQHCNYLKCMYKHTLLCSLWVSVNWYTYSAGGMINSLKTFSKNCGNHYRSYVSTKHSF